LLAESGDIAVVVEQNVCPESFFNFVSDRIVIPARQIGRFADHSPFHVDDARNANARADECAASSMLFREMPDRVAHLADNVVWTHCGANRKSNFFKKLSFCSDGCDT
jgi:hypothetical protein